MKNNDNSSNFNFNNYNNNNFNYNKNENNNNFNFNSNNYNNNNSDSYFNFNTINNNNEKNIFINNEKKRKIMNKFGQKLNEIEKYDEKMFNYFILYCSNEFIKIKKQSQNFQRLKFTSDELLSTIHIMCSDLLNSLDCEGKYYLISAIVNNLRYPNFQTQFSSLLIIKIFSFINDFDIRQIIIRVILERLVVYKPHPWGCIAVFLALFTENSCKEFTLSLISKNPQIENLFLFAKNKIFGESNQQQK
ncbi:ccr4-not transcription complex subunit [Anaeramoeba flamelloides]|uniref:Ccr4-not transcription complex subunit n=1 Tax=Anaeramoeba flamelloides TaxID=1746091 RepID=A0AAV7YXU7_9EUKA|nr:ccr4-not transcription complex subunit [Anaeramoeba flamelloides]